MSGCDIDAETESIEQLRTQLAFFGIHRADEHELRGMLVCDPFALDQIDAAGRHVEQQIDKVIVEQVHFVDVQYAAVRGGKQPGMKPALALFDRAFEVQRSDDAIFGRANRQIHERRGTGKQRRQGSCRSGLCGSPLAANEHAADVRVDGAQQQRELHRLLSDDGAEGERAAAHVSAGLKRASRTAS